MLAAQSREPAPSAVASCATGSRSIPTTAAMWCLSLSDRLFLQPFASASEIGQYSANYRLEVSSSRSSPRRWRLAWLPVAQRTPQADRGRVTRAWALGFTALCWSSPRCWPPAASHTARLRGGFQRRCGDRGPGRDRWLRRRPLLLCGDSPLVEDSTGLVAACAAATICINLLRRPRSSPRLGSAALPWPPPVVRGPCRNRLDRRPSCRARQAAVVNSGRRILFAIQTYPDAGGISSILENYVAALSPEYEVHVAIIDERHGRAERLAVPDSRVHVLGYSNLINPSLFPTSLAYAAVVGDLAAATCRTGPALAAADEGRLEPARSGDPGRLGPTGQGGGPRSRDADQHL